MRDLLEARLHLPEGHSGAADGRLGRADAPLERAAPEVMPEAGERGALALERLKRVARFRAAADSAPQVDSLALAEADLLDAGAAAAAGLPNVLAEDTWDLFRILLR